MECQQYCHVGWHCVGAASEEVLGKEYWSCEIAERASPLRVTGAQRRAPTIARMPQLKFATRSQKVEFGSDLARQHPALRGT
jgi:hypothetical protein